MRYAFLIAAVLMARVGVAEPIPLNPTNVVVVSGCERIVLARSGQKWSAAGVEVEFAADGGILVRAPGRAVSTVDVMFDLSFPDDAGVRVYRDAWERTYGDSGWYAVKKWNKDHPWYMLVKHDGVTDGIGIAVQPAVFASWLPRPHGTRLHLDLRAGADGVELGGRTLEACRVVTRKGRKDENSFAAGRAFAKLMCPHPRLPQEPVYGYNDWYCAYGENTATNFLADAAFIAECAKNLGARPYVVMDDGWQQMSPPEIQRRTGKRESGRGPWSESAVQFGMPMKEFTAAVAALGAKPGLWYRPFRAWDGTPDSELVENDRRFFDPTLPSMEARIREDIGRFRSWGMKLVKIDYIAFDLVLAWGRSMTDTPFVTPPKWRHHDRTGAEVVRDLYRSMREAAGDDMVIIGCNAFNHFAAGLFEVQRTGDDTSGREWARTERMGVNTLAMRAHQDGAFFSVDADCAGLVSRGAVPWAKNRQWIDLLGRSGTAVFVSWFRDLADDEVRRTIGCAYACAAARTGVGEPLDWQETLTPCRWRFADGTEKTYDWNAWGSDIDPLESLLPKPVRSERLPGSLDVSLANKRTKIVKGSVAEAPRTVAAEAYVLEISEDGITIIAECSRGERHAKATLDQLAKLSGGYFPCCRITDWPALKWRGYMNDCGRNYLAIEGVKAILDEMARVKMNLFHWHLTDYHGWRLESKKYPELQSARAFRRQIGKFYTQEEFREIVRYAADRGITVMPELDVPGHSLALRTGLGVTSMADERMRTVISELIEELCSLAPADVMPFVHLGTDEARQLPEYCPRKWVSEWARTINRCGRRAVVWAPGILLDKDIDAVDMAWYDNQITNSVSAFFDAARMYNGSWNPCEVALRSVFTKPCRWAVDSERCLGAITCTWHDDNVGEDTLRLFNDAQVLPSIAAFGDNFWSGRGEDRPDVVEGRVQLRPGMPEFAALEEFESRLAAHRDYVLSGERLPFGFLRQTSLSWRLTDGDGNLLEDDYRGGWIRTDGGRPMVIAQTVITSRTDRVVGAWIDFTLYGSAYSRSNFTSTPEVGEWSRFGGKVEVNGVEILPPVWENPGDHARSEASADNEISCGNDLCERPYRDEGPTRRVYTSIRLRKGENLIRLEIPKSETNRGALFVPGLGTSVHPHEI